MNNFFSLGMIRGLLDSSAPLMLGSLGALLTELSGALGIFIEGFMSLGSFFSWIIAGRTGSVMAGTALTAALAAIAGWALARFVNVTGANPFIAGLSLNLAAGGVTEALSIAWFGAKGTLRNAALAIPGPLLGVQPSVYAAWGFTIFGALLIGRTRLGLRLRSAGRSPLAARERGLRPEQYREFAWAAAAFLAALAGAALTFRVGAYAPGGIAGRGWICLAAVYLGFRRVWGVAAAALIFSLAERIGMGLHIFGALPPTALLGLPSALALALYTVSASLRRRAGPQA
jgi:simple sugar transport system permease protein